MAQLTSVVALRAVTLEVVDQVFARTNATCVHHRAVCNVLASSCAIRLDIFLEATVADALVIILVHTSGLLVIGTLPVLATLIVFAIILVDAAIMLSKLALLQASPFERDRADHLAICGISWIASECCVIAEHILLRPGHEGALCRNAHVADPGYAAGMRGIEPICLAVHLKLCGVTGICHPKAR
jgi:hypothetical protein